MQQYHDRGLMYAEACFETFRVVDRSIFQWPLHQARLSAGLQTFGLILPEDIHQRCLSEATVCGDDVLMRLTATGGMAAWDLMPQQGERQANIYIQAMPYIASSTQLQLRTLSWPFPLKPRMAKFTADYAETLRALHMINHDHLLKKGETALICDDEHLCSTPTANLLIYRQSQWWTPEHPSILPGIIRSTLLTDGCVCSTVCLKSHLHDCKAMALINCGSLIQPVYAVDQRLLLQDSRYFAPLWDVLHQQGCPT